VFSYVMLGAGFFTSQKAKQVVHTGVDMATSSVQLSGDVVGTGNSDLDAVDSVTLTLQLTAGQNPIDLGKTIISFQDSNQYVATAYNGADDVDDIDWINSLDTDANNLLENGEMAQITVSLSDLDTPAAANDVMTFTVIPPQGATLPITVTVPAAIHNSMALY
jgi:archaeal flagellin FlaB